MTWFTVAYIRLGYKKLNRKHFYLALIGVCRKYVGEHWTYYNAIDCIIPDNKVHGANMGPIWGQQDPGGPHVGAMNFATWDVHS